MICFAIVVPPVPPSGSAVVNGAVTIFDGSRPARAAPAAIHALPSASLSYGQNVGIQPSAHSPICSMAFCLRAAT